MAVAEDDAPLDEIQPAEPAGQVAAARLHEGDAADLQDDADVGPNRRVAGSADALLDAAIAGLAAVVLEGEGPRREHVSMQLGNSDFYEGEVLQGQMDGQGHYTFADGNVIPMPRPLNAPRPAHDVKAQLSEPCPASSELEGHLVASESDAKPARQVYVGAWRKGKKHGSGSFT